MAAAIVPAALQVAAELAPIAVPAAVQLFESLLGHSSETGKKQGDAKASGAVAVLTSAAQTMANAGVIPSAGVVDPSLPAVLAGAVEQAVAAMKAQGLLGPPSSDPATSPDPAGNAGAKPVQITGTIQITGGV